MLAVTEIAQANLPVVGMPSVAHRDFLHFGCLPGYGPEIGGKLGNIQRLGVAT